jgi:hypothetical protein
VEEQRASLEINLKHTVIKVALISMELGFFNQANLKKTRLKLMNASYVAFPDKYLLLF